MEPLDIHGTLIAAEGLAGLGSDQQPPVPAQIEVARQFIRARCRPAKTWCKPDSYSLKHNVEHWTRDRGGSYEQVDDWGRAWTGDYFYVSNGAFIAGALLEGYQMKRCAPDSINARFKLRVLRADRIPAPMTPLDVRARLETIRRMAVEHDNETAHSMEDALHREVLRAIADGARDAAALAREALCSEKIDFRRWPT